MEELGGFARGKTFFFKSGGGGGKFKADRIEKDDKLLFCIFISCFLNEWFLCDFFPSRFCSFQSGPAFFFDVLLMDHFQI